MVDGAPHDDSRAQEMALLIRDHCWYAHLRVGSMVRLREGAQPTPSDTRICVHRFGTAAGGTPQAGGVWTNSSNAVVSNIFNPFTGTSDTFTYTIIGGVGCSPASAQVVITLLQSPIAGIDGAGDYFC